MDIYLVAKLKKYDDFISCYNEGDEKKMYKGKSLLFYSLSNNDAESRYLITIFLINKGADVNVVNECGENLLHILLSQYKSDGGVVQKVDRWRCGYKPNRRKRKSPTTVFD